jgi:hypothetical protein
MGHTGKNLLTLSRVLPCSLWLVKLVLSLQLLGLIDQFLQAYSFLI